MNYNPSNSKSSVCAFNYNMELVPETSCINVQTISRLYRFLLKFSLITCNSTMQILGKSTAVELLKNFWTLTELQSSRERSSAC